MRGKDIGQESFFSYINPDDRVPKDHPLRNIKEMVNQALKELSLDFEKMYSAFGRPSIPPEQLLKALLLQILFSIRSERLLIENLQYNLLFRWFVGLNMEAEPWNHSTFSKNRDRLIKSDIACKFLEQIKNQAERQGLLSDEHFTVDGTIIEAWASMKSFIRKDSSNNDNGDEHPKKEEGTPEGRDHEVDFHGEKRRNETHESTTDPDARLYRKGKGKEAKLCYMGHVLMENRNGLIIGSMVTLANGKAECNAAIELIEKNLPGTKRITLGADRGYDQREFVENLRARNVTPHIAKRKRGKAIDGRTTRHEGYLISQRIRKRVEEIFGWQKTIGIVRKVKLKGVERVNWMFNWNAVGYNLMRIGKMMA